MRMVIYHNEACSTSRRVLALLRAAGAEVEVVDYLAEGWTRGQVFGVVCGGRCDGARGATGF